MATIWEQGTAAGSDGTDGPYTLAIEFTSTQAGQVDGVWSYMTSANGGGNLTVGIWRVSDQALLGSNTASVATGEGWRYVAFASPVATAASTAYRVGSFIANGRGYRFDGSPAYWEVTNSPLATQGNGGYFATDGSLAYPTQQFNNSNYWRDPEFTSGSNELEGFRFEKDHPSEGGDWWDAADVNPTGVDGPFGLRTLTDFVGDPASASLSIDGYRRVGDTFWDGPPA